MSVFMVEEMKSEGLVGMYYVINSLSLQIRTPFKVVFLKRDGNSHKQICYHPLLSYLIVLLFLVHNSPLFVTVRRLQITLYIPTHSHSFYLVPRSS
jgi:hypothetical protein